MEQLLQNPAFRMKISSLSPSTRRWFISSLIDLFEQESEYVIDVIEDCREDMRETADRYKDETSELRATSRMLQEKRDNPEPSPKRSLSRISNHSRLSRSCDRQSSLDSIANRMRFRRRRIVGSEDDGYKSAAENNNRCASSISFNSLPSLPSLVVPSSNTGSRTTRSLPVTPTVPAEQEEERKKIEIQEETRAILQNMSTRDSTVEKERERQQARLERIRRQKRFLLEDRTQQALLLLDKALEMDKVLAQDKERQGLQLRQKLVDMKKKREQKIDSEFVEIIELHEK
ncbi:unnamed protein product [Candidula unifasciata]|uniref:Uncharacterized protein n=1 Tax=Candidula unifasciata TaxID=100452 RepID=A0A8S3ZSH6_9EUPU|nr:unnamed protein product [Candidula unifasciata]